MAVVFYHEKLQVYQLGLAFYADVDGWMSAWDSKHAVCDQLQRAAESMVNL